MVINKATEHQGSAVNEMANKPLLRNAGEKPPVKRVLVFTIVAMSLLMTTIDTTIVATALETIQKELHTTVNWAGWTITAYSFGFVLMLPLSAKLTNYFGARRLYLVSVIMFTATSLLCGLVNSISVLIPLRIIQSMGAAGITPSVTAIIVDHFGDARDRAVSLFGSIFPIGVMIGPIFGGLFVTYWTWRWIFFVNVPIGIIVILLSLRFIPSDKPGKNRIPSKLDLQGLIWLGVGILFAMLGATYLGHRDVHVFSLQFTGMILLAIVSLTIFFIHIKRVRNPFIKPVFVYGRGFGKVNLMNLIYAGITSGCISLVPLYVSERYGIGPLDASVMLIAQGASSVAFSTIVTMLLRRSGYRLPMLIGCSIIILGIIGIALPPYLSIHPFLWMVLNTSLMGVGIGVLNPPARNAGLQLAPQKSATIAALRSQALQMGSIIVVGIATAIMTDSANPGLAQAWIFATIGIIYIVCLPIIRGVPEFKGAW